MDDVQKIEKNHLTQQQENEDIWYNSTGMVKCFSVQRQTSFTFAPRSVHQIHLCSILPLIPVQHVGTWGLSHSAWAKRRSPVSPAKGSSHTGQAAMEPNPAAMEKWINPPPPTPCPPRWRANHWSSSWLTPLATTLLVSVRATWADKTASNLLTPLLFPVTFCSAERVTPH